MHQANLFGSSRTAQDLSLEDADLSYWPEIVDQKIGNHWFEELLSTTNWDQDKITVYGKQHLTPRLSYWVGDEWMDYCYAQHTMKPHPWTPLLREIKGTVERVSQANFNSVLINYYRDGRDSNGWHSDCLLYTSPSPRDLSTSRMPSSA